MTALFRRVVNLAVAPSGDNGALGLIEKGLGFDLSLLDCVFQVKKSLKPEPNTCKVKVYNLAPSTRKILEGSPKLVLRLEAGYQGLVAQLFLGEIRSTRTSREGADLVTEIDTGDSAKEVQSARINSSFGANQPISDALTAIAKTFGVGLGNLSSASAKLRSKGSAFFGPGTAISGYSAQIMTDFCRSAGLEWSIQDGLIQILNKGSVTNEQAVLLSADTGLLDSPTSDVKGIVTASCLIQPGLRPGSKVVFDTKDFKGGYRIREVEYVGDTSGNDWTAKLSLEKY